MSYLPYVFAVVLVVGAVYAVFKDQYVDTTPDETAPEPDSSVVVLKP